MRKISICLYILLLVLAACQREPARTGSNGTDFTLKDVNGNEVSLSDYKGKVVLLEFWATWCAPCRQSVPELKTLYSRYKDQGFSIIGISLDESMSQVREFAEEFDIPYSVVLDDRDVNSNYGVISIPTTFLIDREGKVVKKHLGFTSGMSDILAEEIEAIL